jgi:hypothetical protein
VDAINAARAARISRRSSSKPCRKAATSVWAAVVATADEVGGRYCENCHVTTRVTNDEINPANEGVRPYALDRDHAVALWLKSEEMVGERF